MADYKPLEDLTFADDFMFCKVMSNPDIAKQFLEYLFGGKIFNIQLKATQSAIRNSYNMHGVRFDVEFFGDSTVYDIEMQQSGSSVPASQKELLCRTRFYQSSIDTRYLERGEKYSKLPNSRVIFICLFDPFGNGLAQYTQVSYIAESRQVVDNGAQTIYLNAYYNVKNASTEILKLLDYIRDPAVFGASTSFIDKIDAKVQQFKTDSLTRRELMSLYEKLQQERDEGREEGREEEREANIRAIMRKLNYSYEDAANLIGVTPMNNTSDDIKR